eukprot:5529976-Alexandrium_andersonii.AAC.1
MYWRSSTADRRRGSRGHGPLLFLAGWTEIGFWVGGGTAQLHGEDERDPAAVWWQHMILPDVYDPLLW